MLEALFTDPQAVEGLRRGVLGPHLDTFAATVSALGYKRFSVRQQLWLLRDLGRWLKRRELSVSELDEATLDQFLARYRRPSRRTRGDATTVRRFLAHLREQGVVRPAEAPCDDSATGQLLRRYEVHLRQERGLAPVTVATYLPFVRQFLTERFGEGPLHLDTLSPSDLEEFVVHHAPATCAKRAQLMVSALRSLLRFLLQQGEITIDLAASVPPVAGGYRTTVPKYLSPREVERLLKSCDRSTPVGRRDYAILLLLARLGLRASEVLALELGDIHWRAGEIVVRGKGSTRDRLPLPQDVGEALATYLREDRPPSPDRHVFLRARAPHRAFGNPSSISTIVFRALQRADLHPARRNSLRLRLRNVTGRRVP